MNKFPGDDRYGTSRLGQSFSQKITRTEIPFDRSDKGQLIADHYLCQHKQN